MRRMDLKLFRSTGYSSTLMAGETRLALHPARMVLVLSLWTGLACNVCLWRQLSGSSLAIGMPHALALAMFISGASGTLISVCGWRKTIKPAATLVLFAAAMAAVSAWSDGRPVDAALLGNGIAHLLLPSWAGLLRWQFFGLLAALALIPMIWMWRTPLRRLPAHRQLHVNLTGALAGAAVMAAGGWLLLRTGA